MRTSALFGAKTFEFYGVSARTSGREFVQCGQGGVNFFAILYGRLLWTGPLAKNSKGLPIKDVRSPEKE